MYFDHNLHPQALTPSYLMALLIKSINVVHIIDFHTYNKV